MKTATKKSSKKTAARKPAKKTASRSKSTPQNMGGACSCCCHGE